MKRKQKHSVFSTSVDSDAGPNGYNGKKFLSSLLGDHKPDVLEYVLEFFSGKRFTKYFIHTCLALIPKVDSSSTFSYLRPISLSNSTNKIISKIVSNRL